MDHYDCLLIGHNELDFQQYYNILENMASSGGRDHVAFTDLQLNCVELGGRPYQGQDLLTHLYNEQHPDSGPRDFYNGDCLWTGIAYLGTYLAKRGLSFDYINLFHREREQLRQKLKTHDYTVIALTGTMYVFEQNIYELVAFIRKCNPKCRVIAGGPYISKQAEEREPEYLRPLFRYLNADFYCYVREGEQTLVKLINTLNSGGDVATVENIAWRRGREFVINPRRREINPLVDNIIDYQMFASAYAQTGWANVRISDGCPYACGFCAFPEHGNERYEIMPLYRIEQELDAIRAAGTISHIFFIDATMNVPRTRFKDVLRLMIRKQYGLSWHCFFRCDQTDEETVDLMREAGCIGVFLGLESASEPVLRNMNKTAHKDDFRRTIPWLKRAGICQMISMQVGFPGETYSTFRETLDFLEEIQPDFTRPQIWFCDPTTPVWRRREEFNLQGKGYGWSHYSMDAETAVELVVETFFSLRGPVWVPDPGYNWVFLYAMEKLGMSRQLQKTYLRYFAAAAKEKLVKPSRPQIAAGILDNLRRCARFDQEEAQDLESLEEFSGERYIAAEQYWVDAWRKHCGISQTAPTESHVSSAAAPFSDPKELLNTSSVFVGGYYCQLHIESAILGIGLAAALLEDSNACAIVLKSDDEAAFPLFLHVRPDISLHDLLATFRRQCCDARLHQPFALFILSNALRLKEHGLNSFNASAGFIKASSARKVLDAPENAWWRKLNLLLIAEPTATDHSSLSLCSPTERYTLDTLQRVAAALTKTNETPDAYYCLAEITNQLATLVSRETESIPVADPLQGRGVGVQLNREPSI